MNVIFFQKFGQNASKIPLRSNHALPHHRFLTLLQASCTKCTNETREAIEDLAQDAQELVKDIESEVKDALNLDEDEAQEETEASSE